MPADQTYAACLTPPGTGAIATLAVRGPRAWEVVSELFHLRSAGVGLPAKPQAGGFWLGKFGDEAADEVVLAVKRTAPVPWVELHCHGGVQVVRLLLEILEKHGLRTCSWQQLEQLTANPAQAAAAAALAKAPTVRTAAILLDQYHGAFDQAVQNIIAAFAETQHSALSTPQARRLACGLETSHSPLTTHHSLLTTLDELARYATVGRHLTTPWRVVVAGAPNVGKSSLVNALVGYQRSVVAAAAGTTRDVVTSLTAIDGWPVELADTAGLREEAEALEEQGIRLARDTVAGADLCLWLLDAAAEPVWPSFSAEHLQLVVNKTDLPAAWQLSQAQGAVHVSARTGAGLAELCQVVASRLVAAPPPPGAPVPFTPFLCAKVEEAGHCYAAGRVAEARGILAALWEEGESASRDRL